MLTKDERGQRIDDDDRLTADTQTSLRVPHASEATDRLLYQRSRSLCLSSREHCLKRKAHEHRQPSVATNLLLSGGQEGKLSGLFCAVFCATTVHSAMHTRMNRPNSLLVRFSFSVVILLHLAFYGRPME